MYEILFWAAPPGAENQQITTTTKLPSHKSSKIQSFAILAVEAH